MTIELEHNIGDKLWVFKNNKPTEGTIIGVSVWLRPEAENPQWQREVHYTLDYGLAVFEGTKGKHYFISKKELTDYILS